MLDVSAKCRRGAFELDVALLTEGGVTALFGRSGAGKTTLVDVVAGLCRPDEGRVVVDGRVLYDRSRGIDLAPEKRRLGYVFQEPRLFPHLSVRSNLVFGMNRVPRRERTVAMDHVVDLLGVGHLLDRRPAGLSGGEKQRIAIGRALLASPRVLLMDEPVSSLDAARKSELLAYIGRMAQEFSIPILYVSHSMDEVLRLADTLVLVDEGRIAAAGPVEDILSRPDLRSLTGRYDAGAVINGTVAGHDDELGLTRLSFPGGVVVAGRMELAVGTAVRIRIHARDIAIALDRPTRISVRNVIPATVREVAALEGPTADIVLDCNGSTLWAQITKDALLELGLVPGQRVHALVKAVTITRSEAVDRGRG